MTNRELNVENITLVCVVLIFFIIIYMGVSKRNEEIKCVDYGKINNVEVLYLPQYKCVYKQEDNTYKQVRLNND